MISNRYSIAIAKKEIQKSIVNQLYKKEIINFYQYDYVLKKLDEEISKLMLKDEKNSEEDLKQVVVKVEI